MMGEMTEAKLKRAQKLAERMFSVSPPPRHEDRRASMEDDRRGNVREMPSRSYSSPSLFQQNLLQSSTVSASSGEIQVSHEDSVSSAQTGAQSTLGLKSLLGRLAPLTSEAGGAREAPLLQGLSPLQESAPCFEVISHEAYTHEECKVGDHISDKTLEQVYAVLSGEAVVWSERLGGLGATVDARSPSRSGDLGFLGKPQESFSSISGREMSPSRIATWSDQASTEPAIVPFFVPRSHSVPAVKGENCSTASKSPESSGASKGNESYTYDVPRSQSLQSLKSYISVEETFRAYCAPNQNGMENRGFEKLCRECGLYAEKSDFAKEIGAADILFKKVMKGQRRMELADFDRALEEIAQRRNLPHDVVRHLVAQSSGPATNATMPNAIRFHDDMHAYPESKKHHLQRKPKELLESPNMTSEKQHEYFVSELRPDTLPSPLLNRWSRPNLLQQPQTAVDISLQAAASDSKLPLSSTSWRWDNAHRRNSTDFAETNPPSSPLRSPCSTYKTRVSSRQETRHNGSHDTIPQVETPARSPPSNQKNYNGDSSSQKEARSRTSPAREARLNHNGDSSSQKEARSRTSPARESRLGGGHDTMMQVRMLEIHGWRKLLVSGHTSEQRRKTLRPTYNLQIAEDVSIHASVRKHLQKLSNDHPELLLDRSFVLLKGEMGDKIDVDDTLASLKLHDSESLQIDILSDHDSKYNDSISRIFQNFLGGSRTDKLDAARFQKLCRDCHLFDSAFTSAHADLIFMQMKASAENSSGPYKLDFADFKEALKLIAERKGVDVDSVFHIVANSSGPNMTCTKAENVKFHDDSSTYTGTWAQMEGGRRGPDIGKRGGGTAITDRDGMLCVNREAKGPGWK